MRRPPLSEVDQRHSPSYEDSDPVQEDRAMADEANIRACGDSATPFDEEILSQYLPLSSLICPNDNEEGQALYTLTTLLERGLKPGVILTLARFASDTKSFNAIASAVSTRTPTSAAETNPIRTVRSTA